MPRFLLDIGGGRQIEYDIEKPLVTIGRTSGNDLQVPDRRCSRNHAELHLVDDHYVVRDLDSKNKVFINDKVVHKEQRLNSGDRVRIGDTILTFVLEPGDGHDTEASTAAQARTVAEAPAAETTGVQLVDEDASEWGRLRESVAAGEPSAPSTPLARVRGEALDNAHKRLEILYDVADKIRSILDVDELLEQIGSILQQVLTPDSLVLLLDDAEAGELVPRVIRNVDKQQEVRISWSIIDQCVKERVSLLVSDAAQDRRFSASESIVAHRIRSAICAPLIHQNEVLGAVYMDSKSSVLPYQQEELSLVTGIVNQAATAIVNARLHERLVDQKRYEREMEIARSIQVNLLPDEAPTLEGFDIWGLSVPAWQVGGDYFDYVPRGADDLFFCVADVSGKGVPAALLTAIMRASLQIFAQAPETDARHIVEQLNRTICRDSTENMFVSAVVAALNAPRRELSYVNAGHCYPLLFDADGQLRELETGGCFLGIAQDIEYPVETIELPPASTLVIYTDGLTDMSNEKEEMFGVERLIEDCRKSLDLSARELCEHLYATARLFGGEANQFDDSTALVVKAE